MSISDIYYQDIFFLADITTPLAGGTFLALTYNGSDELGL